MFEIMKSFAIISRAEFLMPNLGSLILGLAWGVTFPVSLANLAVLVVLSFTIINLSSAIGAQVNTLSDYSLDLNDYRKKHIVQAMDYFGRKQLKAVLAFELVLTAILVCAFSLIQEKSLLLLMWIVGISLGYAYSAPPVRLKSRFWLAPAALILVLAVFPVLFAYYMFTPELNHFFIVALIGLALTVYGVIVPTEIRDYFGDKAMNIETVTVRLGLVKASLLSMILLLIGGALIWTAFLLEFVFSPYPLLGLFTFVIPLVIFVVLRKFNRLYLLSKKYAAANDNSHAGEEIADFATQNLQWIMIVTQTYSLMSILLLIEKLLI